MTKWRPIDTVPEGEQVLVWFERGQRGVGAMECAVVFKGDANAPGGYSLWTHGGPNSGSDWQLDSAPTHWRPLPASPKV